MQEQERIREAVGLFDNIDSLQEAVRALESTAFPRQDIVSLAIARIWNTNSVFPMCPRHWLKIMPKPRVNRLSGPKSR